MTENKENWHIFGIFAYFFLCHSSSHFNWSYGMLSDLVRDAARENIFHKMSSDLRLCVCISSDSSLCCGAEKPACERTSSVRVQVGLSGRACADVYVCVMVSRRAAERSVFSRGGNRWNGAEWQCDGRTGGVLKTHLSKLPLKSVTARGVWVFSRPCPLFCLQGLGSLLFPDTLIISVIWTLRLNCLHWSSISMCGGVGG